MVCGVIGTQKLILWVVFFHFFHPFCSSSCPDPSFPAPLFPCLQLAPQMQLTRPSLPLSFPVFNWHLRCSWPVLPCPSLSLSSTGISDAAERLGGVLLTAENDICSHQIRSLGSKHTKNVFLVWSCPPGCKILSCFCETESNKMLSYRRETALQDAS